MSRTFLFCLCSAGFLLRPLPPTSLSAWRQRPPGRFPPPPLHNPSLFPPDLLCVGLRFVRPVFMFGRSPPPLTLAPFFSTYALATSCVCFPPVPAPKSFAFAECGVSFFFLMPFFIFHQVSQFLIPAPRMVVKVLNCLYSVSFQTSALRTRVERVFFLVRGVCRCGAPPEFFWLYLCKVFIDP